MRMPAQGAYLLSDYPAAKIRLVCASCGIEAIYDRDACIETGGDRLLPAFKDAARRRLGCRGYRASGNPTVEMCRLVYPDLVRLMGI